MLEYSSLLCKNLSELREKYSEIHHSRLHSCHRVLKRKSTSTVIIRYIIIVVLILAWAAVLVPPYLRNRSKGSSFGVSDFGFGGRRSRSNSEFGQQRFVPLDSVPNRTVHNGTAQRSPYSGNTHTTQQATPQTKAPRYASNVVELRPANAKATPSGMHIVDDFDFEPRETNIDYLQSNPFGIPRTTRAARERRRHILIGLTVTAIITLICSIWVSRAFIPFHILIDLTFVGYSILLARQNQLNAQSIAVSPIRKSVTEEPVRNIQIAPDYLTKRAQ